MAIIVDGRPLASYRRAYEAGGRVFAPVDPLLTRLADRLWYEGRTLVIERGGRRVRVALAPVFVGELDAAYVAVGPVLRALGLTVRYDSRAALLSVRLSRPTVGLPTPFAPAAPSAAPSAVFTPEPVATPRPVWTGSPLPRRTPLPALEPPAE